MKGKTAKYLLFFVILVVGVVADQWTKQIASDRLATQRPGYVDHRMVLTVPPGDAGQTVEAFLRDELSWNTPEEVDEVASRFAFTAEGDRLQPSTTLEAGDTVELINRHVVIWDGYWDFQYTENPGAAFGLLADQDSEWRVPFFVLVSIFAIIMILYILRGVTFEQKLVIWGLSLIASGAVGNFIDRIRFGYVIDFIVWKYTNEYRWPTFNIADALIVVGVSLMAVELIRDMLRERREGPEAAGDESEPAATAD